MKKREVIKKLFFVAMIVLVFTFIISTSYAAINEDYYNDIKSTVEVDNSKVDKAAKSSPVLDAIALLVYAVGSLLEKILGYIFKAMTGDNVFPWADAILFNAIPMLDINVFNPSGASFVYTMQEVIVSTYWTIFSLALSFFGIAIMVTAIKLVVSTIASDKALYKQAVVKWLMGFVMLWGIHFFMSFVIYLNEQLVVQAQEIASKNIGDTFIDVQKLLQNDEQNYLVVENFLTAMTEVDNFNWLYMAGGTLITIVAAACTGGAALWVKAAVVGSGLLASAVVADVAPELKIALTDVAYEIDENLVKESEAKGRSDSELMDVIIENFGISAQLLGDSDYVETLEHRVGFKLTKDSEESLQSIVFELATEDESSSMKPVRLLAYDVMMIRGDKVQVKFEGDTKINYMEILEAIVASTDDLLVNTPEEKIIKKTYKNYKDYTITYYTFDEDLKPKKVICSSSGETNKCPDVAVPLIALLESENGMYGVPSKSVNYDDMQYRHAKIITNFKLQEEGDLVANTNVISTLAQVFKKMAWSTTATSWVRSRVTIEGALLYSILVGQSLVFFISYVKRLFYVIILILMAPIVVVYDFFNKFSS